MPPYWARVSAVYLFRLPGNEAWMQNLHRVDKISGPNLSPLLTKVHEIFRRCRRPLYCPKPLSIVYIVFCSEDICGAQFFRRDDPNFSMAVCERDLLFTIWQSLVEFHLLISVCVAWQWSRKQNLWRVGKNSGPILCHLWTKFQEIFSQFWRPLVLLNALAHCLCSI